MQQCNECGRDFGNYETLGKCPMCGVWAKIVCPKCGRTADAKQYIDHGKKCPKCDTRVSIPGKPSLLVPVGIAAILLLGILWVVNKVMNAP